jgi:hypothetical protein
MSRRHLTSQLAVGPNRHPSDQVKDGERFCRHYLDRAFDGWTMFLEEAEYDDSLQLLMIELQKLADRFDEGRNDCFASYARQIIPKRAADVGPRRILGRNGNRLAERWFALDEEAATRDRVREPDPAWTGDPDPDRRPAPGGLQADRDRERARAAAVLGLTTAARAA